MTDRRPLPEPSDPLVTTLARIVAAIAEREAAEREQRRTMDADQRKRGGRTA